LAQRELQTTMLHNSKQKNCI